MNLLTYLFAAGVGIAAALASIAIWAPRVTFTRVAALIIAISFIPLGYVQLVEMLSRPKPMAHEWFARKAETARVLAMSFEEGKAIYLWLRLDGDPQPRYYSLPWRQSTAEELEDAMDDATRRSGTVILEDPFFRRSFEESGELNPQVILPPLPLTKPPPFPPNVLDPRKKKGDGAI